MDLIQHLTSRETLLNLSEHVTTKFFDLTKFLATSIPPNSGPYALFPYISSLTSRICEVTLILRRLYDTRVELLKYDSVIEPYLRQAQPDTRPSPPMQMLWKEIHDLDNQIVLDFQTLLIFTAMTMDSWAIVAAHILNLPNPTRCSFHSLAEDEGSGNFAEVWRELREDILWLDAFPRLYRNKMIIHREQPWQFGHMRTTHLLDWNLWTPIVWGWVSDTRSAEIRKEMDALAATLTSDAPKNIHELIYFLLDNSPRFNRDQREKIITLTKETGIKTPTFQHFGHQLFEFLDRSINLLSSIANRSPEKVNLGPNS